MMKINSLLLMRIKNDSSRSRAMERINWWLKFNMSTTTHRQIFSEFQASSSLSFLVCTQGMPMGSTGFWPLTSRLSSKMLPRQVTSLRSKWKKYFRIWKLKLKVSTLSTIIGYRRTSIGWQRRRNRITMISTKNWCSSSKIRTTSLKSACEW